MSIFPSASSPTLSVLSDEFPGCQTLYLHSPSLFPPLFPLFLHHLWHISVLLPRLWLRVGTGEVVGGGEGMGDGWCACFPANWNIHVCVPVSLCESAFTCTPSSAFIHICVSAHDRGIKNTAARKDVCTSICVILWKVSVHTLCQVTRKAPPFELAPKLRLCTSITHDLLYMGSHNQVRRRN